MYAMDRHQFRDFIFHRGEVYRFAETSEPATMAAARAVDFAWEAIERAALYAIDLRQDLRLADWHGQLGDERAEMLAGVRAAIAESEAECNRLLAQAMGIAIGA